MGLALLKRGLRLLFLPDFGGDLLLLDDPEVSFCRLRGLLLSAGWAGLSPKLAPTSCVGDPTLPLLVGLPGGVVNLGEGSWLGSSRASRTGGADPRSLAETGLSKGGLVVEATGVAGARRASEWT